MIYVCYHDGYTYSRPDKMYAHCQHTHGDVQGGEAFGTVYGAWGDSRFGSSIYPLPWCVPLHTAGFKLKAHLKRHMELVHEHCECRVPGCDHVAETETEAAVHAKNHRICRVQGCGEVLMGDEEASRHLRDVHPTQVALAEMGRIAEDSTAQESMLPALSTAKNNFLKALGTGVQGAATPSITEAVASVSESAKNTEMKAFAENAYGHTPCQVRGCDHTAESAAASAIHARDHRMFEVSGCGQVLMGDEEEARYLRDVHKGSATGVSGFPLLHDYPKVDAEPDSRRRLYLGNLPHSTTKADIEHHFRGTGKITDIKLFHGFAFLEYKDWVDALHVATPYHGSDFMGQRLVVDFDPDPQIYDRAEGSASAATPRQEDATPTHEPPLSADHREIDVTDYGTTSMGLEAEAQHKRIHIRRDDPTNIMDTSGASMARTEQGTNEVLSSAQLDVGNEPRRSPRPTDHETSMIGRPSYEYQYTARKRRSDETLNSKGRNDALLERCYERAGRTSLAPYPTRR